LGVRFLLCGVQRTRRTLPFVAAFTLLVATAFAAPPAPTSPTIRALPDVSLLQNCAFVSVDVQEAPPRSHVTEETVPKLWKSMGITATDVNAATDYAYDVAFPNAVRVADACRAAGLPMIFIHWGSLFRDGMDLDPTTRAEFIGQHGLDYSKWGHSIGDPYARPASFFKIRPGEYVIPKTAQDAFTSSNLLYVLKNLGVKTIIFIGGHTGARLGRTADSAKKNGFRMICVDDATFDARQSTRRTCIDQTGYDAVLTTAELEQWLKSAPAR
jgi:nicotinamidase-related amidase